MRGLTLTQPGFYASMAAPIQRRPSLWDFTGDLTALNGYGLCQPADRSGSRGCTR
jgi:hypothetical protein